MAAAPPPAVAPFVVVIHAGSKYTPKKLAINGGDDPFERYLVTQLLCQVVGKGKMIKTMFLNLDTVASELHVPPAYITAWFGYEIGASFKYDPKKPDRERGSISGDYPAVDLSIHMNKFIKEVVLCSKCTLPELWMKVTGSQKSRRVSVTCDSCGTSYTLKWLSEKFKNFIVNHPPPPHKQKDAKATRGKLKKDDADGASSSSSSSSSSSASSETPETFEPPPVIIPDLLGGGHINLDELVDQQQAAAALGEGSSESKPSSSEPVTWFAEDTEEARRERELSLAPKALGKLMGLSASSDGWVSSTETDPSSILQAGVMAHVDLPEITDILLKQVFGQCDHMAAFGSVLQASANTLVYYFSKEKSFQPAFLDSLITFILSKPSLLPSTTNIFNAVYSTDVLAEEEIVAWWEKKKETLSELIAPLIEPFIQWLNEAESESDSDDEESE